MAAAASWSIWPKQTSGKSQINADFQDFAGSAGPFGRQGN
jgi:hypothetical protein